MGSSLGNSRGLAAKIVFVMHPWAQRFHGKTGGKHAKEYLNAAPITKAEAQTMQVKVHYISLVKSYTNKSQEDIAMPDDATVAQLLDHVADEYGKQFKAEVFDTEKKEMRQTFVAMVNGVLADQLKGMETTLKNGDNVILMSLMTGG
jgi:MoaD family protein